MLTMVLYLRLCNGRGLHSHYVRLCLHYVRSTDCDRSTPQDLISNGLYARVAVAFHTGQHRTVSLCLLAQEIIKETSKSPADKVVDIDRR